MEYNIIKEQFPKSVKLLESFVMKQFRESLATIDGDGVSDDYTDDINKAIVANSINHAPGALMHFFDEQDIKIAIIPHPEAEGIWLYYSSADKASKTAYSRKEATDNAVSEAFSLLEKRL